MKTKTHDGDDERLTHLDAMLLEAMESAQREGHPPEEVADILRHHAETLEDQHYPNYRTTILSD